MQWLEKWRSIDNPDLDEADAIRSIQETAPKCSPHYQPAAPYDNNRNRKRPRSHSDDGANGALDPSGQISCASVSVGTNETTDTSRNCKRRQQRQGKEVIAKNVVKGIQSGASELRKHLEGGPALPIPAYHDTILNCRELSGHVESQLACLAELTRQLKCDMKNQKMEVRSRLWNMWICVASLDRIMQQMKAGAFELAGCRRPVWNHGAGVAHAIVNKLIPKHRSNAFSVYTGLSGKRAKSNPFQRKLTCD